MRKASENKDFCPKTCTSESGSYKEPSSKFRNFNLQFHQKLFWTIPIHKRRYFLQCSILDLPSKMSNEHCGGHNSCWSNKFRSASARTAPSSEEHWRVSIESRHSLHWCGRTRGQRMGDSLGHGTCLRPNPAGAKRRQRKSLGYEISSQKPTMTFVELKISLLYLHRRCTVDRVTSLSNNH